jgi:hypothetical protein
VPRATRSVFHWELGRILVETGQPQDGLKQYWTAYELEAGTHMEAVPERAYGKALLIESAILDHWDNLDLKRQLERARLAHQLTKDPQARATLNGLVSYLQRHAEA